jgi:dimethylargininase
MLVAVTRGVSPSIADCELTHLERTPIDIEIARAHHAAYEATLTELGCRVEQLPAEPGLPDSVFVEDVAVVLEEVAVITRPGAESRRGERSSIERTLEPYRTLAHIRSPGILDGGDVLVAGHDIHIGLTSRSDTSAIDQFRAIVGDHGYRVHGVAVRGCLHLKSAVTAVADDTLVINPERVNADHLGDRRCISVDPTEPDAANVVRVGGTILVAAAYPRTADRISAAGFDVRSVEASELAKAEGALTCCSLIFDAPERNA